jgi:hypothetical protein
MKARSDSQHAPQSGHRAGGKYKSIRVFLVEHVEWRRMKDGAFRGMWGRKVVVGGLRIPAIIQGQK